MLQSNHVINRKTRIYFVPYGIALRQDLFLALPPAKFRPVMISALSPVVYEIC